jgi:hypothetical protein
MSSELVPSFSSDRSAAKEYARFCRLRGIFLAEGLEAWRLAMEQRKVPPEQIRVKVAEAARFVAILGQSF